MSTALSAWQACTNNDSPLTGRNLDLLDSEDLEISLNSLASHLRILNQQGYQDQLAELTMMNLRNALRCHSAALMTKFHEHFALHVESENVESSQMLPHLKQGMEILKSSSFFFYKCQNIGTILKLFIGRDITRGLRSYFRAMNSANLPEDFQEKTLRKLCSMLFRVYVKTQNLPDLSGYDHEKHLLATKHTLTLTCEYLFDFGNEALFREEFSRYIYECLDAEISGQATDSYDVSVLDSVIDWIESSIIPIAEDILQRTHNTGQNQSDMPNKALMEEYFNKWKAQLYYRLYELLGKNRISKFFDILIDYPESKPALLDLKLCLLYADLKEDLVWNVHEQLQKRLLHPGAMTTDIIIQYSNLIKSLVYIEDSGVLAKNFGAPIKEYLRNRSDTIRCIVSALMGEGELAQEFQSAQKLTHVDDSLALLSEDEEYDEVEYDNWIPDTLNTDHRQAESVDKDIQILGNLIGIFGSKEIFAEEYKNVLAEKIFNDLDHNIDQEARNLEFLKFKFGDSVMQTCSVMLRDVTESRRINAGIADRDSEFDPIIISKEFWPKIPETEKFSVPSSFEKHITKVTDYYEKTKAPRKLKWQSGFGVVRLSLSFEDGGQESVDANPLQAAILLAFNEKPQISKKELCEILGISQENLEKKISFWTNQGVLAEVEDGTSYMVQEHLGDQNLPVGMSGEERSTFQGSEAGAQDDMQFCEKFVIGMLTNFDSLPLNRIHNMLKMFIIDPAYDKTEKQLRGFLEHMVDEEKLRNTGGLYSLNK